MRPKPHGPRIHNGVDLRATNETPVLAPNNGVVEISDYYYLEGGFVVLNHGDGILSNFMHLSRMSVAPGEYVSAGQIIGFSGASGATSAPHLHFELWVHGIPVDPLRFMDAYNMLVLPNR
jgi:murein DD-endopeptidase MepM/ murein hydrolase activator NlpD